MPVRSGFDVWIDCRDLIRFVQNTVEVPPAIHLATARALNRVGEKVVNDAVAAIAAQTGADEEAVKSQIEIWRASPDDTVFRINAASALLQTPGSRPGPWARRIGVRRPSGYFHSGELVKIVTMGDERVCEICNDKEAETEQTPITIEEARLMLPLHINCRCAVQPNRSRRTLPVAFRKGQSAEIADVTTVELAEKVVEEVDIALRATYGPPRLGYGS